MLPDLFLALQLLDGVKQRDGMTPSDTPGSKPQEQFVTGIKKFVDRIKNPFKR